MKKGLEFSFAWMFALIVGAVIIFLAIYATMRLVDRGQGLVDTVSAAETQNLLEVAQTGIEASKVSILKLPIDVEITTRCSTTGIFGEQRISAGTARGLGSESESIESTSNDLYLFSDGVLKGDVTLLSMPFEFPFRVGNLVIAINKNYCFVNAPNEVQEPLEQTGLNGSKINFVFSLSNCARGSVTVCFTGDVCDVNIDSFNYKVTKDDRSVYAPGNLMYGAIIGDTTDYECQVTRLMKRTSLLAESYMKKSVFVAGSGCANSLGDIQSFVIQTSGYNSLKGIERQNSIVSLYSQAKQLKEVNENAVCKIF